MTSWTENDSSTILFSELLGKSWNLTNQPWCNLWTIIHTNTHHHNKVYLFFSYIHNSDSKEGLFILEHSLQESSFSVCSMQHGYSNADLIT